MANWFPVGKEGANTTYAEKSVCELAEGQECFDVSNIESDVAKVVEVEFPVLIEVVKERTVKNEQGQDVVEQYVEIEQAKDESGKLLFDKRKVVIEDAQKKSIKKSKKEAEKAEKKRKEDKLADLKKNAQKDVKDLIDILGL